MYLVAVDNSWMVAAIRLTASSLQRNYNAVIGEFYTKYQAYDIRRVNKDEFLSLIPGGKR